MCHLKYGYMFANALSLKLKFNLHYNSYTHPTQAILCDLCD
jgi:hypothetical protein